MVSSNTIEHLRRELLNEKRKAALGFPERASQGT